MIAERPNSLASLSVSLRSRWAIHAARSSHLDGLVPVQCTIAEHLAEAESGQIRVDN
jgi:hypothetical protein